MSPDLVGFGLAVHGVLCSGAVFAIWKLHGESNFGKQPQEEMRELRGRVLRSIAQSLVNVFEPILSKDTSVAISQLLQSDGTSANRPPRITTTGKENLRDAVRDFVKSDIAMLKSLRQLDNTDACITQSLIWLRRLTLTLAVTSALFLVLAALSHFDLWHPIQGWPHILGLCAVGILVVVILAFIWRISHSINVFDRLRDKHADLS